MLLPITSIRTWWFFRPDTPEKRERIIASCSWLGRIRISEKDGRSAPDFDQRLVRDRQLSRGENGSVGCVAKPVDGRGGVGGGRNHLALGVDHIDLVRVPALLQPVGEVAERDLVVAGLHRAERARGDLLAGLVEDAQRGV